MLDVTKPVQTRKGEPARIICTDAGGRQPLVALISKSGGEQLRRHFADGRLLRSCEHSFDLVNVPERIERFAAIYTPPEAPPCLGCLGVKKHPNGKNFVKIVFEDGKPVSAELVK